MKRNLLALAVGAAIVMPGVALADAATVYGRMDVSLDRVSIDNDTGGSDNGTNWAVSSNASRFGVKGGADLTDSLKALYVIEWQVSGDGDAGDLAMRNRYVGLSGGFGTVVAGRMDTPMKTSQGKFDLFNDHAADIGGSGMTAGDNRVNDLIAYTSPKIAGMLTAKVALQPGEENESGGACTADADDATKCKDGVTDGFSLSLSAEQAGLYGAVAYDNDINGMDTIRFVGVFKADNLQAGLLYETTEQSDSQVASGAAEPTGTAIIANVALTAGSNVFKAQIGQTTIDWDSAADDTDATLIAIGAEHRFNKQTLVYAEYTDLSVTDGMAGGVGFDASGGSTASPKASQLSVGMLHKF